MRNEEWWMEESNAEHIALWVYWDNYHMNMGGDHDDYHHDDYMDCEWKGFQAQCSDFERGQQDYQDYGFDCYIDLSYSPCEDDFFVCTTSFPGEDGSMVTEDCTSDFEDVEFWNSIREDPWWMIPENQQFEDFHMFWDDWHFGTDDYNDYNDYDNNCWWREMSGECEELTFTDDDCSWYLSWSPCEEDYFVCRLTNRDEYGNEEIEECAEDFTDPEFWAAMREEQIWHNPDNMEAYGFYMFWDEWHYGTDDYNDHDYDHHGDDEDCEWKGFEAKCSDFQFGHQDYMDYGVDCDIALSYSPCEDDFFVCTSSYVNEYGNMETVDCQEDFEDIEFWDTLRNDPWWEFPENMQF
jgi:hypothetical protein